MAKKRKNHLIGKKEFIFNFISLIVVIGIGLYFGIRSFYYYGKQNFTLKEDAKSLNGLIISNNKVIKSGDGLHQDSEGYYFKGAVSNNFVKFGNRLFRIVRVNNDKSVKVVSEDLVASFMWGEDSKYESSNLRNWLDKTENKNSGVYYNTIPSPKTFLRKTNYQEDILENDNVKEDKKKGDGFITTLGVSDYILAGGKSSFLNNNKIFFLLGLSSDSTNLYVEEDGSIQSCDSLDGYGVRAVLTFKSNLGVISGDGSVGNPYLVDQGKNLNYIDSYVRLGTDVYKVFQESKDGKLKMYRYGYINVKGVEFFRNYSSDSSMFNLNDKKNIAYFLNSTYLSSLPYAKVLVDNYYYTGEVSAETGYSFDNVFNESVVCKIGLLNIFDYVSNNYFNDFFHMNTTSTVGRIQYSKYSNGLLEEVDVREEKHIVPVVSIDKNIIKGGKGLENDPYVVE